jgi:heterodisulfide reductase subunit A-like polyferredoxin
MTHEERIVALAVQAANTIKAVNAKIGNIANLSTTDKTSIVAALNELKSNIIALPAPSSVIDDATASLTKTYSSTKINALITTAVANLINGAGSDSDTLKELADKIVALAQTDTGLVSVALAQSFTDVQKAQARTNIGAASATDLATLATNIGNTDRDFVADFNTAYLA